MCDQDHSEKELQELDASGLITRRQFGVLLGAGVAMILPQTPNAVKVTEAEVTIKTPDGMADAYFVHPSTGTAPGVLVWPDIFGLRPAFNQMGKRLAESGYSVLVVNPFYRTKKAPTAEQGAATQIQGLMPPTSVRGQEPEDGHARLLYGRPDRASHGSRIRSRRRSGFIPWRWTGRQWGHQPASYGFENQGTVPHRHRNK
jgi:hypothetical protein